MSCKLLVVTLALSANGDIRSTQETLEFASTFEADIVYDQILNAWRFNMELSCHAQSARLSVRVVKLYRS